MQRVICQTCRGIGYTASPGSVRCSVCGGSFSVINPAAQSKPKEYRNNRLLYSYRLAGDSMARLQVSPVVAWLVSSKEGEMR